MPTESIAATERETLEHLLGRTRRTEIPLRHSFIHRVVAGGGPGPMAQFLRRPGALDFFLLLLATAVNPPHNVKLPAAVWSRALGHGQSKPGETWVSKTLRWLEGQQLVVRKPVGRERDIFVRHECGDGSPYTRPDGKSPEERFIRLPHAYFTNEWHKHLSASGKAVLLIALANKDDFELNQRRGARWWGVSTDTLGRGLNELVALKLLETKTVTRTAPESRVGYTTLPLYRLTNKLSEVPEAGTT